MTTTLDLPFQLGRPQQAGGVTMTPLFPLHDPVCDYVSLDEALAGGLQISEVDEAGDVGELAVRNPLDRGVLLYDGEELVGALQNRIVNVAVLLGAGSTTRIPVSCVERGRWSPRGGFRAARHVAGPELRRRKARALRADELARGAAQQAVWTTVAHQLDVRGVDSPTEAAADAFAAGGERLSALAGGFPLEPGQCGTLAAIAGQGWCLDLVSRPEVFATLHPKLVAGYAFDALDAAGHAVDASHAIGRVLAAPFERRKAAGEGTGVHLDAPGVLGSGVLAGDELVALSVHGGQKA